MQAGSGFLSAYLPLLQLSITPTLLERMLPLLLTKHGYSPGQLAYIIIPNLKCLSIPIMEFWDNI